MNFPETGRSEEVDKGVLSRINLLAERAGGGEVLALEAGLSKKSISRFRAGGKPSARSLRALAEAGGTTFEWLARGEGPGPGEALHADEKSEPPASGDLVSIPRFDALVSAGPGSLADRAQVLEHYQFSPAFLKHLGVSPATAGVIEIRGDSMYPTLRDGDLAVVDWGIKELVDDGIYVVTYDSLTRIKRLQRRAGALVLISDNRQLYEPETVPIDRLDEVTIDARLGARVQRL